MKTRQWLLASLLWMLPVAGAGCDTGASESVLEQPNEAPVAQERGGLKVGSEAPNFRLLDLEGKPVTLSSYRGRVVLLNFWATWCAPCRVEMPAMEALYREFDRRDFEILAISTDPQGVAATRPFKEAIGLSFPILHDATFRVGVAYGARTLPMTFLVDRRGIITYRIFGARDWQSAEARQLIRGLLKAS